MRGNHKFTIIMAVALLCIVILFLLWAASPALAVGTTRQEALHEAAEILRAAGYKDDDAVIKMLSEQWWIEEKKPWREDVPLSADLQAALLTICEENGVDPLLALGLIETESGFQPDIVSAGGDYGLCQLNKLYFDSPNMTPEENMAAGIGLLAANIRRYGSVEAALTAYNRGHDDGSRWYASAVLAKAAKWGYGE